jgi:hypothetical protein
MSANNDFLNTYYYGVTQRLQLEIDYLNSLITHTGERGVANENSLTSLLVKFLPKKYNVGSGIIIDKNGNHSRQVDIIIYDSDFHPELFSQGAAASLYPVDVVYMTIEIKTTMTKGDMNDAIENIASIKRLKFIESPIHKLMESPTSPGAIGFTATKTSPPIGVIFAFDCNTTNFETFESWIKSKTIDKKELFDLCYILHTTFTYTFQDLDRKNQGTRCVYPLSKSVREQHPKLENLQDFEKYKDDVRNPLVQFYDTPRVVDQGGGFLNFLSNLYHMLELKHIIQRSILRDYLTDRMLVEMKIDDHAHPSNS